MPFQVKSYAAEQWTLSRTAWTNTGQKILQMSNWYAIIYVCRAHFKGAQTVVGQCFAGNGPNGLSYYYYDYTYCTTYTTITTTTYTIYLYYYYYCCSSLQGLW